MSIKVNDAVALGLHRGDYIRVHLAHSAGERVIVEGRIKYVSPAEVVFPCGLVVRTGDIVRIDNNVPDGRSGLTFSGGTYVDRPQAYGVDAAGGTAA